MEVEGLGEGEELWKKYCSFFDKPFSEQVEYNNDQMEKYFAKWKKTKIAKKLCPKGVKKLEDVPLTTYDDYPILHEFGEHSEREAAKLVFETMKKLNPEFRNYVTDFRIKDPFEVIKVEYLRKGAFMRYSMKQGKTGAALGNLKPPKTVTADKSEIADLLRSV
jgi:RecG-like helicase